MIDFDELDNIFNYIHFAKSLAEQGFESIVDAHFPNVCNSEVYYDLEWLIYEELSLEIFDTAESFCNEKSEIETTLMYDPKIELFCKLAQEYGKLKNIPLRQNPYILAADRKVSHEIGFSYSTEGKFICHRIPKKPKGKWNGAILIQMCLTQEYIDMHWYLESLLNMRRWFQKKNDELSAILKKYTNEGTEHIAKAA